MKSRLSILLATAGLSLISNNTLADELNGKPSSADIHYQQNNNNQIDTIATADATDDVNWFDFSCSNNSGCSSNGSCQESCR